MRAKAGLSEAKHPAFLIDFAVNLGFANVCATFHTAVLDANEDRCRG